MILTKLKTKVPDVQKLAIKLFFSKTAILVYQMGKVGSTTVYFSLKKQFLFTPVFHVHCLGERALKEQEKAYQAVGKMPSQVRHLRHGNFLRNQLNESAIIKWKIITLVRDPIIREISIFFQQKEHRFPNGIDTNEIIDILQQKFASFKESTDYVCTWFEREIKSNFNVNVYDFWFDKQKGYCMINKENIGILIIRLEDLNNCFNTATKKFFSINKNLDLRAENVASYKEYKAQYIEAIAKIKIPRDVCELIYSSRYAKHFYSDEMLNKLIEKWTKESK
ncbi:conserved hypothetical protein [Hyella patelloides LEGE 07179]|uniref:Capsular polysaccharide synthesis protein n=1 Tax=Hyella patelloides LEGE 07179 TaxID=945734 RepID=A0A563VZF7_9CYAN|nr:putative capsular polysaccharide synthesis family protein [Hyella patelloides]VEP16806.1 conserved hypothetical protein [Hyella patelloides LEGE 07179]